MKLKPLYDNVVIKPFKGELKTESGIVLPDSAKEKPTKGEVVAVGHGKMNEKGDVIAVSIKKGDTVLFKEYGFSEIEIDGDVYLIGKEDNILGTL